MSRNMRLLVLVMAVVVLGVGFVLAREAGDDEPSSSAATAVQTQPADPASPEGDAGDEGDAAAEATESEATQEAEPREPRPPLVVVEGAQPVGGVRDLVFQEGEQVDFRVRSDVDEEIHVHGYDEVRRLPAGETVRVRFPADITGRFEVELHGAAVQIARLEVRP